MQHHFMVCISGWAGTGKDECSGRLVNRHGAIHTGLADPGKRHLKDTYKFSSEQLWGPSKFRNAGDVRYPKDTFNQAESEKYVEGDPVFWLSPREALQKYMELMNTLYSNTWIRKGIEDHRSIATNRYTYSKTAGLLPRTRPILNADKEMSNSLVITCFSDFRHIHEHKLARESTGNSLTPVLIRIKRPTITKPPFSHRSETEQTRIRDEAYDFIINNDSSLEHLYQMIDDMVETFLGKDWKGKTWDPSFVLPDEGEGYPS
jgi:hypothetical protein